MKIEILPDMQAAASRAAALIAVHIQETVKERDRYTLAVSGGSTPWHMLRALANEEVPWDRVHIFQVDERIAPRGSEERNLTHLRESLLTHTPIPPEQIHAMPVDEPSLGPAGEAYARLLESVAGTPPTLDLAHLGLGPDGHTASLVPNDPVLEVIDTDVSFTRLYQGRMRMTLTYPVLNRARCILWLVTGDSKVEMLRRLAQGDQTIPAGRIQRDQAIVVADQAAAREVQAGTVP